MEAELAASGADTVIGLMGTDGWDAVRPRVLALFRRGERRPSDQRRVEGELEAERREVVAARERGDATVIADLEVVWRTRLRRLLDDVPSAAAALRELVAENVDGRPSGRSGTASAGRGSGGPGDTGSDS